MNENKGKEERLPKLIFSYTKSSEYKQYYVTGARGGIRPYDFRLDFYNEEPERDEVVEADKKGRPVKIKIPQEIMIHREYKTGIIMSPRSLLQLSKFLNDQINKMKEEGLIEEL